MRADCFPIIQTPPPPPLQPPLRCHCSLISPLWTRNYYSAWITTMWRRQKKQLTPQRQEISHSVYDRIPRASGEAKRKEKAVRWHCTSTWDLIYTRKAQRMRSKTCQMWSSNKYLLNVALSHTLRLLPPASTIATPEPRSSNESGCRKPSLELFLRPFRDSHTLPVQISVKILHRWGASRWLLEKGLLGGGSFSVLSTTYTLPSTPSVGCFFFVGLEI